MAAPKLKAETLKKQAPGSPQLEEILKKATDKGASDVHLKAGLPPIVRIHGRLYYLRDKTTEKNIRLSVEQLTAMCDKVMSPKQKGKFEVGLEVDLALAIDKCGRFRVNICQQRGEPRIVARHIPDITPTIEDLNLPPIVAELAMQQRGLILVTGATGSGKSTTLAAMIDHITRHRSCHIVTVEDPIEFSFKDRKSIVTQREVGQDTPNFAQALKYALRQDPDVILIGEMRDEETVRMALTASETGHLVLSTLHTADCPETINRILNSISEGMQAQIRAQLAFQLKGVISQRLLSRKDGAGRIAGMEILVHNRRVQECIGDPKRTATLSDVITQSKTSGMQSFDQSLMDLYQRDLITKEEALTHSSNARDFELRLAGVTPGDWIDHEQSEVGVIPASEGVDMNDELELDVEDAKLSKWHRNRKK